MYYFNFLFLFNPIDESIKRPIDKINDNLRHPNKKNITDIIANKIKNKHRFTGKINFSSSKSPVYNLKTKLNTRQKFQNRHKLSLKKKSNPNQKLSGSLSFALPKNIHSNTRKKNSDDR